ncbi:MAG TPA: hypothetical protein VFL94_04125, partial [Actinomycetales bacterium]|nr:hypothetical protein [Actinomycetales bacterium]
AIHEDSLRTVHRYQEVAGRALLGLEPDGDVRENLTRMQEYFGRVEQCYRDAYPTAANTNGEFIPSTEGASA